MKNYVYLGTALHMIFLANLSPCFAMEDMMYTVEDLEGKRTQMSMRFQDNSVIIQPTEVMKLNTIFSLSPSKMEERQVAFVTHFQGVENILAEVSTNPLASNHQKEVAKGWLDETLATGEGALSNHFRTLTGEKNDLSSQVQALVEEKTTLMAQNETANREKEELSNQYAALYGEKDGLSMQLQSLTEEKNGLSLQVQTFNGEKDDLLGQIGTLTEAAQKAKTVELFERIVSSIVTGDKDMAIEYICGLMNNDAYSEKAGAWKQALENNQNNSMTEHDIANLDCILTNLISDQTQDSVQEAINKTHALEDSKSPFKGKAREMRTKLEIKLVHTPEDNS